MEYSNTWDWALKIKLHMKVCKNPPKGLEVKNPKVYGTPGSRVLWTHDTKRSFTSLWDPWVPGPVDP